MQTRVLGPSDLHVSVVGLGCNNFGRPGTATADLDGTKAVLDAAIEHGVTFLDTADVYGGGGTSETLMGEALKGRRDTVVLATKFGATGDLPGTEGWGPKAAKTYVTRACEASLRRLQTDHIDVYQLHVPHPETPIGDTLEALNALVDAGKVRWYGHSNFDAAQVRDAADEAARRGVRPFVSAQNNYSLVERAAEASLLPAVQQLGLGFLPYFPLASGLLTGKYSRTEAPEGSRLAGRPEALQNVNWAQLEDYQGLCEDAGVDMLEATMAWLLAQPSVTSVIAGATSPAQVTRNAEAATTILPADMLAAISEVFAPASR